MKEITGNIFDIPDADAICVTTNGVVKRNGELVMGAGIAKQFAERYPDLPQFLGNLVTLHGNQPYIFNATPLARPVVVSFPSKYDWKNPSSLDLIRRSALYLRDMVELKEWKKVVLPRPGCGYGGLKWETVKKVIEPILDDRFYIITP